MLYQRKPTFVLILIGLFLLHENLYAVNYSIAIREIPVNSCLSKKSKSLVNNISSCGSAMNNSSSSFNIFSNINNLLSQAKHYVAVLQIDGVDQKSICFQLSDIGNEWQAQILDDNYLGVGNSVEVVFTTPEGYIANEIWRTFKSRFRQVSNGNRYIPLTHDCETTIRRTIQSFGGLISPFPFAGNSSIFLNGLLSSKSNKQKI